MPLPRGELEQGACLCAGDVAELSESRGLNGQEGGAERTGRVRLADVVTGIRSDFDLSPDGRWLLIPRVSRLGDLTSPWRTV